jgi:glycosyltransferase involved in cell wall biosynthesis
MSSHSAPSSIARGRRVIITSRCAQTIYAQRRTLALGLKKRGWDVVTAGDVSEGGYEGRLSSIGLKFEAVPVSQKSKNPLSLLVLFFSYAKLLSRERPDVFHAFTIKPTVVGLIVAALFQVPARVATVAGLGHIFLSSSGWIQRVTFVLLRVAFRCAHSVIFYNADDLSLFRKHRLVRADQAKLILGSGVDTAHFSVLTESAPAGDEFIVLFIGRLLKEKGLVELFEAARLLKSRSPRVRVELLGDIDRNNPSSLTAAEVSSAVSEGLLVHHGSTSDVRPYIARANVIVLPSYREGIPLSLLEGAAMGKPLVATRVPGCQDVVVSGKTGILVPPKDAFALAEAIGTLAADVLKAEAMGRAARADVERRFSASVVTDKVIAEYERLLCPCPQAAPSCRQA